jgi:murein DD-endopeptidase MepM/ murein hydrolase activator NlpD
MAWPEHAPAPASPLVGQGGGLEEPAPIGPELPVVIASPASAPATPTLRFGWPLPRAGINSLFGYRVDPMDGARRFHSGVDLEGAYGQVVAAAAAGRVVHAGWSLGHGRQVVLEHAGGFISSYSHLATVLVDVGARTYAGQPLGMLGNSGRSTGPHLHFEIRRNDQPLDPLDVLEVPLTLE